MKSQWDLLEAFGDLWCSGGFQEVSKSMTAMTIQASSLAKSVEAYKHLRIGTEGGRG